MTTPHLALPELTDQQDDIDVTVNESLRKAEAVIMGNVKDRDLTAPPGSPADGDRYIPAATATGAWAGWENRLVFDRAGTWVSLVPEEGWPVYVQDENLFIVYNGSAWVTLSSLINAGLTLLGLSDVPDSYTSQAFKTLRVNSGATAVEFVDEPFDVGGFLAGLPAVSALFIRVPVARAVRFADDWTGSVGKASATATAQTDFDIQKNGSSVGTMRFAAAASTATFLATAGATDFAAGDVISVVAPASQDATLANVGFSLKGLVI